jgi:hypothetical protein
MMYSHFYICKKPYMSKKQDANIIFGGVGDAGLGVRRAGEEARGTLNRLIDHGALSRETRAT